MQSPRKNKIYQKAVLITHKNADTPILNPICFIFCVSMCACGHVCYWLLNQGLEHGRQGLYHFPTSSDPNPVSSLLSAHSAFLNPACPISWHCRVTPWTPSDSSQVGQKVSHLPTPQAFSRSSLNDLMPNLHPSHPRGSTGDFLPAAKVHARLSLLAATPDHPSLLCLSSPWPQ